MPPDQHLCFVCRNPLAWAGAECPVCAQRKAIEAQTQTLASLAESAHQRSLGHLEEQTRLLRERESRERARDEAILAEERMRTRIALEKTISVQEAFERGASLEFLRPESQTPQPETLDWWGSLRCVRVDPPFVIEKLNKAFLEGVWKAIGSLSASLGEGAPGPGMAWALDQIAERTSSALSDPASHPTPREPIKPVSLRLEWHPFEGSAPMSSEARMIGSLRWNADARWSFEPPEPIEEGSPLADPLIQETIQRQAQRFLAPVNESQALDRRFRDWRRDVWIARAAMLAIAALIAAALGWALMR